MLQPTRARSDAIVTIAPASTVNSLSAPSLNEWLKRTSVTGWRGKELQALDKALGEYARAVSDYAKDSYSKDVWIAFMQWTTAEGPKWRESPRNKSGAFSELQAELAKRYPRPVPRLLDSELALTLRRNLIYFLSMTHVAGVPANLNNILNDAADLGSDVQGTAESLRKAGVQRSAGDVMQGRMGADATEGFLSKVSDAIKNYLGQLPGAMLEYGRAAMEFILAHLPDLLKAVLGGLAQQATAIKDIAGGLLQAGRSAVAVYTSRTMAINTGSPKQIIESVRDQIKDYGVDGIKTAVEKALLAAIGVANPIAGTVCSVLASIYGFVTSIYNWLKSRAKMAALIDYARKEFSKSPEQAIHGKPEEFNVWFKEALDDLPILSAYCMTMPFTGSYFGFLTLIGGDGNEMSTKQLERQYGIFNDVKAWAKDFVKEDPLRLQSPNTIIAHSFKAARSDGVLAESAATLKERIVRTFSSLAG